MKRSKTSKQWMREHVNDVYVQRAKSAGYRSRAAYKLLEIAARDRLLRPGMVVVDLGAAPGGWAQVAQAQVGARGLVVALDVLEMAPLPGVTFLQGDFREDAVVNALAGALAGVALKYSGGNRLHGLYRANTTRCCGHGRLPACASRHSRTGCASGPETPEIQSPETL